MAQAIPFDGLRYDPGGAAGVADALDAVLTQARQHGVTPATLLAALAIAGATIIARSRTGLDEAMLADAVRVYTLAVLAQQQEAARRGPQPGTPG